MSDNQKSRKVTFVINLAGIDPIVMIENINEIL